MFGSISSILQKFFIWVTSWSLFLKKEKEYGSNKFSLKKYYLLSKGFCSDHPTPYDFQKNRYSDYISDLDTIKLAYINYPYGRLVRDKLVFSNFFNSYFKTPECFCVINRGKIEPVNAKTYIRELNDLIELTNQKKLILKPQMGTAGKGIILLEADRNSDLLLNKKKIGKEELNNFINTLDTYLITEFVEQGEFSKQFFPGTANTIRLTTLFNHETSSSFVPYSFMRFGREKTIPADNISQGGIFSMIDVNTGKLLEAIQVVRGGKPNFLTNHPDTGAKIKDINIPGWDELKNFFIEIGTVIKPFIKIVGWDIILTDDSFVVIEGNNGPNITNIQGAGYLLGKIPEVNKFLKYYHIR